MQYCGHAHDIYARQGHGSYWGGYLAGRLAPLGAVTPGVAASLLYCFAPDMMKVQVQKAWGVVTPADAYRTQLSLVDAAMQDAVRTRKVKAAIERALQFARRASNGCNLQGRTVAAAIAELPEPGAPHLALWYHCTLLREHRFAGHVAALLNAELDPVGAHITLLGGGTLLGESRRRQMGWSLDHGKRRQRTCAGEGGSIVSAT